MENFHEYLIQHSLKLGGTKDHFRQVKVPGTTPIERPAIILRTTKFLTNHNNTNKMNWELMLTYDTPALLQTGSRKLTGQKTLPTIWGIYMKGAIWGIYMKLVTKYQISAINSCWEKCDEKWAYMFNVYKNQQSRQTGIRNLMGPKTLLTIWGTDMKLVTKYQICVIYSYWEKCDKKFAYTCMFNVYKNQLSRQTGSRNLTGPKTLPTIWHTYMKLGTKYQISAIDSCWENCDEKYLRRTDGGKTVYPPPPPGSGGIITI